MEAPTRRLTWVLAALLAFVSLPVSADTDSGQCDAGICDPWDRVLDGDCGGDLQTACDLAEGTRLSCRVSAAYDPGTIPPEGTIPPGPVDPGIVINPSPIDTGRSVTACSSFHEACEKFAGPGCYVASLRPRETQDVYDGVALETLAELELSGREPCNLHSGIPCVGLDDCAIRCENEFMDDADAFTVNLEAGTYRFAMGQASAPWDYSMCVYAPDGTLHENRVPNSFPQTPGVRVPSPGDPQVGPVASVRSGSVEKVTASHASAGDWTILVRIGSTCPSSPPVAGGDLTGLGETDAWQTVHDQVDQALAPIWEVVEPVANFEFVLNPHVPAIAGACAPFCSVVEATAYCFGFKKVD